jgi:hypothetical protein
MSRRARPSSVRSAARARTVAPCCAVATPCAWRDRLALLWLGASARRTPGHAGAAHKYSYWVSPSVAGQIVRSAHAHAHACTHHRTRARGHRCASSCAIAASSRWPRSACSHRSENAHTRTHALAVTRSRSGRGCQRDERAATGRADLTSRDLASRPAPHLLPTGPRTRVALHCQCQRTKTWPVLTTRTLPLPVGPGYVIVFDMHHSHDPPCAPCTGQGLPLAVCTLGGRSRVARLQSRPPAGLVTARRPGPSGPRGAKAPGPVTGRTLTNPNLETENNRRPGFPLGRAYGTLLSVNLHAHYRSRRGISGPLLTLLIVLI